MPGTGAGGGTGTDFTVGRFRKFMLWVMRGGESFNHSGDLGVSCLKGGVYTGRGRKVIDLGVFCKRSFVHVVGNQRVRFLSGEKENM